MYTASVGSAMSQSDRVSVQTYVPAAQRDRWREEADELDMSQAEYVRTMVQAGRRGFDLETGGAGGPTDEPGSPDATPRGDNLKDRILDVLDESGVTGWETLLSAVTDDFEARLEGALQELREEGRVRHSPREGGYAVVDDGR